MKISDDELEKLIVEFEGLPDMMTPEGREHYYALCELQSLRAEVTKRHEANRWNVYRYGDALMVCLGDHEKHEDCTFVRYVPESEVTKLRADAESVSAEREACAKLCEMVGGKKEGHSLGYRSAAWECAALIRGRGANNA